MREDIDRNYVEDNYSYNTVLLERFVAVKWLMFHSVIFVVELVLLSYFFDEKTNPAHSSSSLFFLFSLFVFSLIIFFLANKKLFSYDFYHVKDYSKFEIVEITTSQQIEYLENLSKFIYYWGIIIIICFYDMLPYPLLLVFIIIGIYFCFEVYISRIEAKQKKAIDDIRSEGYGYINDKS